MPFPRASQALSRFTVLDLTRVRSGPTCVRQLADWGANVIKIDALMEDAAGEQPGGPRHGSDFAPQQARDDAQSEGPERPRSVSAACGKGRRGGREFSSRRQGPARHRL